MQSVIFIALAMNAVGIVSLRHAQNILIDLISLFIVFGLDFINSETAKRAVSWGTLKSIDIFQSSVSLKEKFFQCFNLRSLLNAL
jgi:hypothetical protein